MSKIKLNDLPVSHVRDYMGGDPFERYADAMSSAMTAYINTVTDVYLTHFNQMIAIGVSRHIDKSKNPSDVIFADLFSRLSYQESASHWNDNPFNTTRKYFLDKKPIFVIKSEVIQASATLDPMKMENGSDMGYFFKFSLTYFNGNQ